MGRKHRRFIPSAVERFESRELLSGLVASLAHLPAVSVKASGSDNGNTRNEFLNPTGQPTTHERVRQQVRFIFKGSFIQGRGRFDYQASQLLIRGVGTSNFFLHGDVQIGIGVPTDPTKPVTGVVSAFDRNVNSNSGFGFDLTGSTASLDRAGRPTQFTFTVDQNISSGLFVEGQTPGQLGVPGQEQDTVSIRYIPNGRRSPGVLSQGQAIVLIKGPVYTLGVNNILGVLGGGSQNTTDPSKIRPGK
jgi:hypothetical protein